MSERKDEASADIPWSDPETRKVEIRLPSLSWAEVDAYVRRHRAHLSESHMLGLLLAAGLERLRDE